MAVHREERDELAGDVRRGVAGAPIHDMDVLAERIHGLRMRETAQGLEQLVPARAADRQERLRKMITSLMSLMQVNEQFISELESEVPKTAEEAPVSTQ